MAIPRIPRLEEEMRAEIARIVQQDVQEPGMGFVTITRVELTKDLSFAKVFYSCLGSEEQAATAQQTLQHAARYIHGLLGKRFRLRTIPRVSFKYDPSIAGSIDMSARLEQLQNPPPEPPAA